MKKILLNYLIIFICAVGFRFGAKTILVLPILQIYLSWYNYHYSNKWQTVLMLEIHLLISTVIGIFLEGYLYLKYISNDVESIMILILMMTIGVLLVCIMGIIITVVKYFSTKNKKDFD